MYFGGAAVILIGGAIVLLAPYHYVNYSMSENGIRGFEIWEAQGYYPYLEISVSTRAGNVSEVNLDFILVENVTHDTYAVNFTLTEDDLIEAQGTSFYEADKLIDLPVGNYTVILDHVIGTTQVDVGLNQASDSRIYITVGGSMNIIGLVMCISGYLVSGTFLPTDSDTIVEWGYDEDADDGSYQAN